MTPNKRVKPQSEDAPADFPEIMDLTPEEKKELLQMWKEVHK